MSPTGGRIIHREFVAKQGQAASASAQPHRTFRATQGQRVSVETRRIGPVTLRFSGRLDITVTHQIESRTRVDVDLPASPSEQAMASGWLISTTLFGAWLGSLVGEPVVGGLAGLVGGQRQWNRWQRRRHR